MNWTSPVRRLTSSIGARLSPSSALGRRLWQIRLHGLLGRHRVGRLATRILGRQYDRSRSLLEIDITYACNLSCDNCNRSVAQAPSSEAISAAEIGRQAEDWAARGVRWQRIRLLGGEPTLHPEFLAILDVLRAYRDRFSPETAIEVSTNGFGARVQERIAAIPADVAINNSHKELTGKEQAGFVAFNVAPRDLAHYAGADFSNGCHVLRDCGIGLAPGGYYPCAVAAGIDRILGLGLGRPALPDEEDDMLDELRRLCAYCGHFRRDVDGPLSGPRSSPSWDAAYSRHKSRTAQLGAGD